MTTAFRTAIAKSVSFFVALPSPIKAGLTAVVLWVASIVFTNLIILIPFLQVLEQFKEPIALALAGVLIGAIEKAVPDAYAQVAIYTIQLILAILAMFGIGAELAARGVLPALLS